MGTIGHERREDHCPAVAGSVDAASTAFAGVVIADAAAAAAAVCGIST